MKKCEKCGNVFDNDCSFCATCGIALTKIPEVCSNCGTELSEEYDFCPSCGTRIEIPKEKEEASEIFPKLSFEEPSETMPKTEEIEQAMAFQEDDPLSQILQKDLSPASTGSSVNGLLKNKKLIAGAVAAIVIIAFLSFKSYTAPRNLKINFGDDIEVDVGGTEILFSEAEGLTGYYDDDIVWTVDNPNLIKIEDGILEASYDKDAFNANNLGLGLSDDGSSYTTYIHGTLDKGLRTWEGDAKVKVSLEEEFHINGQVYVDPSASKDSYIEVKAADTYSTYFYLKSQTDSKNDISFIVDKGEEATIYVPCDTYEIYEAHGDVWYGPDIVFGPNTQYTKSETTAKFTPDIYWTLELNALGGNSKSDAINSDEFPDSGTEETGEVV